MWDGRVSAWSNCRTCRASHLLETAVGDHLSVGSNLESFVLVAVLMCGCRRVSGACVAGQKTIAGETVIADMSGVMLNQRR